jgi:uncharacterized linocin/CFP29 family protein
VNHLLREQAPLSDRAWEAIDAEASRVLRHFLAARQLVDLSGPYGWEHSAGSAGVVQPLPSGPVDGVGARLRRALSIVELRSEFAVNRSDIDDIDRGRPDADLSSVVDAARRAALGEDQAVFRGFAGAGIQGIVEASPHGALAIPSDYNDYPRVVARAVHTLREATVGGPYAIALGPRCYTGVIETTEMGGYPVLEHLRLILGGPVVWAPAVDGAVVVSTRGSDFELTLGEDFSVGYSSHDSAAVNLYVEESLGFRVINPEAAIALAYTGGRKAK